MYAQDQPVIASYVRSGGAPAFSRVVNLASMSIQMRWHKVGEAMDDLEQHGAASKWLWASKPRCYAYTMRHGQELYADCLARMENGDLPATILRLADVPGLGVCKAGFVIQLAWGKAGCLDVHNLRRLGLSYRDHSTVKGLKPSTALKRANLYLSAIEQAGGTEVIWNDWCNHIATLYPVLWAGGEAVSQAHWRYLGLERINTWEPVASSPTPCPRMRDCRSGAASTATGMATQVATASASTS